MNRKTVREVGGSRYGTVNESICYGDVGSTFGRASTLERSVRIYKFLSSFLNGLNLWTTAMKSSQSYCYKTHDQAMAKDWQKLPTADREVV